jgi:hypothetical protein
VVNLEKYCCGASGNSLQPIESLDQQDLPQRSGAIQGLGVERSVGTPGAAKSYKQSFVLLSKYKLESVSFLLVMPYSHMQKGRKKK